MTHDDDDADNGRYLLINQSDLSDNALNGLIEEFVSRDGTDYGDKELSLTDKCERLKVILAQGEAKIVFDTKAEQVSIIETVSLPKVLQATDEHE